MCERALSHVNHSDERNGMGPCLRVGLRVNVGHQQFADVVLRDALRTKSRTIGAGIQRCCLRLHVTVRPDCRFHARTRLRQNACASRFLHVSRSQRLVGALLASGTQSFRCGRLESRELLLRSLTSVYEEPLALGACSCGCYRTLGLLLPFCGPHAIC